MSFSRTPYIKFTQDDADGNPLSYGKVYTYIAGTSTPATTYSNISGTSSNTNPVVLDISGEADIYLDDSFVYKFVIKNDSGYIIETQDNISSVGGSGSGSSDNKVKITNTDPVADYLNSKIIAGAGIIKTINTDPSGDQIKLTAVGSEANSFLAVADTSTIYKGKAVCIVGWHTTLGVVKLGLADKTNKLPVIGIAAEDINTTVPGQVVSSGEMVGVDTSAFSINDRLYPDTLGVLTNTRPLGVLDYTQVVAIVSSVSSTGTVEVLSNDVLDVPNVATWQDSGLSAPSKGQQGFDGTQHIFADALHTISTTNPSVYTRLGGTSSPILVMEDASGDMVTLQTGSSPFFSMDNNQTSVYLSAGSTNPMFSMDDGVDSAYYTQVGSTNIFQLDNSNSYDFSYLDDGSQANLSIVSNSTSEGLSIHLDSGISSSNLTLDTDRYINQYLDTSSTHTHKRHDTSHANEYVSSATVTNTRYMEAGSDIFRSFSSLSSTNSKIEYYANSTFVRMQAYKTQALLLAEVSAATRIQVLADTTNTFITLLNGGASTSIAVDGDSWLSNALTLGTSKSDGEGKIRYDTGHFQGYNGTSWVNLDSTAGTGTVTGTGTAGYIPVWNSSTGLTDSAITDSGTSVLIGGGTKTLVVDYTNNRVGIGTSNPTTGLLELGVPGQENILAIGAGYDPGSFIRWELAGQIGSTTTDRNLILKHTSGFGQDFIIANKGGAGVTATFTKDGNTTLGGNLTVDGVSTLKGYVLAGDTSSDVFRSACQENELITPSGSYNFLRMGDTVNSNTNSFRIQRYSGGTDLVWFIHDVASDSRNIFTINSNHSLDIGVDTDISAGLSVDDNIRSYGQIYSAQAVCTTAIDWDDANFQKHSQSGAVTFTFAHGVAGASYGIRITLDGGTITWPSSVKWPGGTPPTLSASGKIDLFTFYFDGTNYYGVAAQDY